MAQPPTINQVNVNAAVRAYTKLNPAERAAVEATLLALSEAAKAARPKPAPAPKRETGKDLWRRDPAAAEGGEGGQ